MAKRIHVPTCAITFDITCVKASYSAWHVAHAEELIFITKYLSNVCKILKLHQGSAGNNAAINGGCPMDVEYVSDHTRAIGLLSLFHIKQRRRMSACLKFSLLHFSVWIKSQAIII